MTGDVLDLESLARVRGPVYRFLLAALDKPTPEQHAWLIGADASGFAATLAELCERFGVAVPPEPLFPPDFADHQARYIATFEVGLPAPPVVLLASRYDRRTPAPRVVHEHLLLYRHFGLKTADANLEPADHLLNELAFLVHLDDLLLAGQTERRSLLLARRDFLKRYAAVWPAQAAAHRTSARAGAAGQDVPAVYRAILSLLAAAVAEDLELSESSIAAEAPGE